MCVLCAIAFILDGALEKIEKKKGKRDVSIF